MSLIKYRKDIDGLRAVAVLIVVIFHADIFPLSGGFVGVDVFFVISGFLITSIIVKELNQNRFSFNNFWLRRIRRILPVSFFVLLIAVVMFSFTLSPDLFKDFGQSLVAQTFFSSNILFWEESGYFDTSALSKPLLHTWSLSVEEQFYFVYPGLLFIVHRYAQRYILPIIAILCLGSFGLSVWGSSQFPSASFYFLPMRAWELGAGAMLALYFSNKKRPDVWKKSLKMDLFSLTGLVAILGASLFFDEFTPFPSFYAALPVFGAIVIIWSGYEHTTIVSRLLSLRPIVFIGLISYSLYLWHWIALVFLRSLTLEMPSTLDISIAMLLAIFASIASYYFIETPTRNRELLSNKKLVYGSLVTAVILISIGLAIHLSGGVKERMDIEFVTPIRSILIADCFDDKSVNDVNFCELGDEAKTKYSFVVIGDSHSGSFISSLDELSTKYGLKGLYGGTSGCLAFLGVTPVRDEISSTRCEILSNKAAELIKKHSIKDLIIFGRWSYYTGPSSISQKWQPIINSETRDVDQEHSRIVFQTQFDETIEYYKNLGVNVTIVKQVPYQTFTPTDAQFRAALYDMNINSFAVSLKDHHESQKYPNSVFDANDYINTISTDHLFCANNSTCIQFDKGRSLYIDHDHLSLDGSIFVMPALEPLFTSLANAK